MLCEPEGQLAPPTLPVSAMTSGAVIETVLLEWADQVATSLRRDASQPCTALRNAFGLAMSSPQRLR
jgi:hypothetical protein